MRLIPSKIDNIYSEPSFYLTNAINMKQSQPILNHNFARVAYFVQTI